MVSELNRKLKHKKIKLVEVRTPKVISIGPKTVANIRSVSPKEVTAFRKLLEGDVILSVTRRAKMLIFDFKGPLSMLVHLKMTGQFIYEDKVLRNRTGGKYRIINKPSAPFIQFPTKHTHVIFSFTDGSTLYFSDIRKFGYLKVVKDTEINQVKELQSFGPEPLSKQFTLAGLITASKTRKKISIKQFLMDPKVVTGIGNIYSDEILFHAKVRPNRRVVTLTEDEWQKIYRQIPIVLKQGIKYKGSSVGDFVRTDGQWGSMGKYHWVYGRYKETCKVCESPLKRVTLGGRTSTYCSVCQI